MAALEPGTHDVETSTATVNAPDGTALDVFLAAPVGGARTGVVVHPDIGGLRPLFEDLARRLASHGYAVGVFEHFARIDADRRASMGLEDRFAAIPNLADTNQLGDMARTADELVARAGVTDVVVMGFCIGGMYALKAAATGRYARAVSFYGMLKVPEAWRGGELAEPLRGAPDVCPTILIVGGVDPWIPTDDIDELHAVWADRDDCEIVFYPEADHGFVHDAERPAHRADDAADAWGRVLAFLEPLR